MLCPSCHTTIDKNIEDYPVEKLHFLKSEHELWVEQTLSKTKDLKQHASDMIYLSLIDSAGTISFFRF